jgi:SOS response regulatory protein OraA/RecX
LELRLINDERFARLWISSRLKFARSPRRLLAALCAKGIEREDAQAALKNALSDEETEFALLSRYAGRLARRAKRKGEEDAASLKYMLKSEGFSPQAIARFLEERP